MVGQNGAGKTTFARVVAGIVRPDSGMLSINGRKLEPGSVASARSSGVELVHQSFALPPSFTVAEAMEFGSGGGIGFFSRKELVRRGREHLEALDMDIDRVVAFAICRSNCSRQSRSQGHSPQTRAY